MANIIKFLEKEMESGRVFSSAEGNTYTEEQLRKAAEKEYIVGLKKKIVPVEVPFCDYYASYMEDFVPVSALVGMVKLTIRHIEGGQQEESAENVAM